MRMTEPEVPVDGFVEAHVRALQAFGLVQLLRDELPDERKRDCPPELLIELVLVAAPSLLVGSPNAFAKAFVHPGVHSRARVPQLHRARRHTVDLGGGCGGSDGECREG